MVQNIVIICSCFYLNLKAREMKWTKEHVILSPIVSDECSVTEEKDGFP